MIQVADWFAGLATVGGFLYFMAGFGCAFVARLLYCTIRHERLNIPWHYIGIVVGCSAIIVTTMQSSSAYTTAKLTAQEVQDCQREFNAALLARSKITAENDELSENQRLIVFNWIHDLLFPPTPYNTMSTNDPRRQDYGYTLTIDTERRFQRSLDRQQQLQDERAQHPLPDPTCGK